MKNKTTWFEHLIPLFIAVFPVLSLALENIEFIQFSSILRSLLVSVFAAYFFYMFFYLILKNQRKSGILTTLLIFILFSYGNVYISLENQIGEAVRHIYLLGIFAAIFILIGAYVIFRVKNAKNLSKAIFTGGLVIVIYLLISIGVHEFKEYRSGDISEKSSELFTSSFTDVDITNHPDIYLILLDGHTRSDVIKKAYDYDNSEFIFKLEELGFWVADCAQSNYPSTKFSITSLFEMDYLHNIYKDFDDLVLPPLNNTSVFRILSNNDYSTVTFHNFVFEHFNIKDDIRLAKEDDLFGSINEFEKMVVDTSILRILVDVEGVFPDSWVRPFKDDFYLTHYRDAQYALDTLPTLPELDERIFVYAHMLVTHDPFVFMPDGSFSTSKQRTVVDYRNAVEFIDNALPDILEEIISKSEEPPIIIIMGDHGATLKRNPIEDRMSILLAIYLQGEEPEGFYERITPVNVFRLIFNYMLDANFELLEDKSYEIWNKSELGNIEEQIITFCSP